MKRALCLIFFISLSSLVCKGQEYPDISYEEVESSRVDIPDHTRSLSGGKFSLYL